MLSNHLFHILTLSKHNDRFTETHEYIISKMIGRGKNSFVYSARDASQKQVCVKMEPIHACEQIDNEANVLRMLIGCSGVPKLVFHGTTNFRGSQWRAIVTGETKILLICLS